MRPLRRVPWLALAALAAGAAVPATASALDAPILRQPATPTNLPVTLSWGAVAGATGYSVRTDCATADVHEVTALTYPTGALADGVHGYCVLARHGATLSLPSNTVSFVLDTHVPTGGLSLPAANAVVRGATPLAGAVSDPAPSSGTGLVTVDAVGPGGIDTTIAVVAAGAPFATTWSTFTVPDGVFTLRVHALDAAGNALAAPEVTGVVVDNTPPNATLVSPVGGATISGVATLQAAASDDGSGVASVVFQRAVAGSGQWLTIGGALTAAPYTAQWGLTEGAAAVAPGSYDVRAVVTDQAGNQTMPTAASVMVVAPAPPEAARDAIPPAAPRGLAAALAAKGLRLRWTNPARDFDHALVVRNATRLPRSAKDGRVVYRGRGSAVTVATPTAVTRYAVFALDAAGNVSRPATLAYTPRPTSPLAPDGGIRVTGTVTLRWPTRAGADYYHVQLYRGGRRVALGYPVAARWVVPRRALVAGARYVWFVWPGKGAPALGHFGQLIGRGSFSYG